MFYCQRLIEDELSHFCSNLKAALNTKITILRVTLENSSFEFDNRYKTLLIHLYRLNYYYSNRLWYIISRLLGTH